MTKQKVKELEERIKALQCKIDLIEALGSAIDRQGRELFAQFNRYQKTVIEPINAIKAKIQSLQDRLKAHDLYSTIGIVSTRGGIAESCRYIHKSLSGPRAGMILRQADQVTSELVAQLRTKGRAIANNPERCDAKSNKLGRHVAIEVKTKRCINTIRAY